jgi:DNA-binding NarL/FixJ family response regulator
MFDDPERVNEALRLCARCPVLVECRLWALLNAVDGVAGGMTEGARAAWRENVGFDEPQLTIADFLPLEIASADQGRWGKGRSAVILRAVAERTLDGHTSRDIANDLGVTRRTVCRLRAKCRDHGLLNPYVRVS